MGGRRGTVRVAGGGGSSRGRCRRGGLGGVPGLPDPALQQVSRARSGPSGLRLVPGPGLPALGAASGPFAVAVSGSVLGSGCQPGVSGPGRGRKGLCSRRRVYLGEGCICPVSPLLQSVQASVPACSEQLFRWGEVLTLEVDGNIVLSQQQTLDSVQDLLFLHLWATLRFGVNALQQSSLVPSVRSVIQAAAKTYIYPWLLAS